MKQGSVSRTTQGSGSKGSGSLWERARDIMPGGVSSPVRAAGGVGGAPLVVRRGEGAFVEDLDGLRYVDMQMAFGPLLVGHAHPGVVEAVQEAAGRGLHHGALVEDEVNLVERLVGDHPGLDWLRFVNSGTEAVMSALRLARAATKRDLVVKFAGGYHGHADALLSRAGSGVATLGVPDSAGVPAEVVSSTVTLPLDDEAALEALFAERGDEIAAVLMEGVPANQGLLPQRDEWYRKVRSLTREHGALWIVDEVITGTRLDWGGACARFGLEPDLVTLGKVIGGGLPVGAYGGRRDLMELVAPLGEVYQAGTLSGSPVAMAAGLATLEAFAAVPDGHRVLEERTAGLARALEDHARDAGVPLAAAVCGSLLWVSPEDLRDRRRAPEFDQAAKDRFKALHAGLRKRGVWLPPSPYEVCFLSTAHDEEVLRSVLDAVGETLREVARNDA